MKFTVEDISSFKKAVATVCALASKKVVSTTEQCILIKAVNKDTIELTAVESESHALTLTCSAAVLELGEALILATKLKTMSSRLNPKVVVIVSSLGGILKYETPPYGSISESLYHDQTGFTSPLITGDNSEYKTVSDGNDLLPSLLPIVCASVHEGKNIFLRVSDKITHLYSQFSQSGYVKYSTPTVNGVISEGFQTFQMFLKPNLVKIISSLGKEVDVQYNSKEKSLRLKSDFGTLTVMGDTVSSTFYNSTDHVLSQAVTGEVVVDYADLVTATNWQSYNAEVREAVDLSVEHNELIIQCNKNNEPAHISALSSDSFVPITVPLGAFLVAMRAIGAEKSDILPLSSVVVQQRVLAFGENKVKIISLGPVDETDSFATAMLYEQRILNK